MSIHVVVSGSLDTDWLAITIPSIVGMTSAVLAVLGTIWYQGKVRKKSLGHALRAEVTWIMGRISKLLADHSHTNEIPRNAIEFMAGSNLLFRNSATDLGIFREAEMLQFIQFHSELTAMVQKGIAVGSVKKNDLQHISELGAAIESRHTR